MPWHMVAVAHTLTGARQGSPGDMQTRRCFEVCCARCELCSVNMKNGGTLPCHRRDGE